MFSPCTNDKDRNARDFSGETADIGPRAFCIAKHEDAQRTRAMDDTRSAATRASTRRARRAASHVEETRSSSAIDIQISSRARSALDCYNSACLVALSADFYIRQQLAWRPRPRRLDAACPRQGGRFARFFARRRSTIGLAPARATAGDAEPSIVVYQPFISRTGSSRESLENAGGRVSSRASRSSSTLFAVSPFITRK